MFTIYYSQLQSPPLFPNPIPNILISTLSLPILNKPPHPPFPFQWFYLLNLGCQNWYLFFFIKDKMITNNLSKCVITLLIIKFDRKLATLLLKIDWLDTHHFPILLYFHIFNPSHDLPPLIYFSVTPLPWKSMLI